MNEIITISEYRSPGEKPETIKVTLKDKEATGTFETGSFLDDDHKDRHHICISSAAGCQLQCTHCATTYAETPFERKLSPEEIIFQVSKAIRLRTDSNPKETHLGFMGNGDFMGNFEHAHRALSIIIENIRQGSMDIAEIGISTIGINEQKIPQLIELVQNSEIPVFLQYSAIHPDPDIRKRIIPLGNMKSTLPYLDEYAKKTGIPVRYNYPMIEGFNDTPETMDAIYHFINESPNQRTPKLSSFNPFPGVPYIPSQKDTIKGNEQYLRNKGLENVHTFIADPKAGCGLLRNQVITQKS